MFPKVRPCIWRDQFDPSQVVMGSVTHVQTCTGMKKSFTAWLTCHIDALLHLANKELYDRVEQARPDQLPLPLTFEIRIED